MADDDGKVHEKASKTLNYMINRLENNMEYYEADIEWEYTPFEDDIKHYCDSYFDAYVENNMKELFFDSLKRIVNAMVECTSDMYDENFSRPAELITYYFGKIISTDADLKDSVHDWLLDFCRENEGDMLVEDYFKPFINGEKIYHADSYYTNYKDLNSMMRIFK